MPSTTTSLAPPPQSSNILESPHSGYRTQGETCEVPGDLQGSTEGSSIQLQAKGHQTSQRRDRGRKNRRCQRRQGKKGKSILLALRGV